MSHSFDDDFDADDRSKHDAAAEAIQGVERFVREIASDPLLCGAAAAVGLSVGLQLAGRTKAAGFVGLWAPTLLLLGIYRRATKTTGDETARRQTDAAREREDRFEGGCASPPDEKLDEAYLAAAREVDDYSDRISRSFPHKAK